MGWMDPFFDLGLLTNLTYSNLVCFLGAKQKIVMGWCASLSWLDVNSLGLQVRINAVWSLVALRLGEALGPKSCPNPTASLRPP